MTKQILQIWTTMFSKAENEYNAMQRASPQPLFEKSDTNTFRFQQFRSKSKKWKLSGQH